MSEIQVASRDRKSKKWSSIAKCNSIIGGKGLVLILMQFHRTDWLLARRAAMNVHSWNVQGLHCICQHTLWTSWIHSDDLHEYAEEPYIDIAWRETGKFSPSLIEGGGKKYWRTFRLVADLAELIQLGKDRKSWSYCGTSWDSCWESFSRSVGVAPLPAAAVAASLYSGIHWKHWLSLSSSSSFFREEYSLHKSAPAFPNC